MVGFLPLQDGAPAWAEQALKRMRSERPDAEACNDAVRESAFSIENSAARLLEVYCSAGAPEAHKK